MKTETQFKSKRALYDQSLINLRNKATKEELMAEILTYKPNTIDEIMKRNIKYETEKLAIQQFGADINGSLAERDGYGRLKENGKTYILGKESNESDYNLADDIIESYDRDVVINEAKEKGIWTEIDESKWTIYGEIAKIIKSATGGYVSLERDHAKSLKSRGYIAHTTTNIHLLQSITNNKKNISNWERYTIEKQVNYIDYKINEVREFVEDVDVDEEKVEYALTLLRAIY